MNEFRIVDYSDSTSQDGRETIPNSDVEVKTYLKEAKSRGDVYLDLISSKGDSLTIAIRGNLGVAHYMDASGEPPYLCAVSPAKAEEKGTVEFYISGEPTPFPRSICLPVRDIVDIALHFYSTGARASKFLWKQ